MEQETPITLNPINPQDDENNQENWKWDNELQKVEKKYQIISSVIFKYWILILTIITTITIFFVELQKRKTLSFDNEYEARKIALVWQYENEKEQNNKYNQQFNVQLLVKQWFINVSEELIQSFNNLINYKWYTLPRWTFLYKPDEIKDIEYFKDSNYDIAELEKMLNNTIFINFDDIQKNEESINLLPLKNKSIEDTFYISCANQHKIFNWVCNNYINKFLKWFFVYNITDDIEWFKKTRKNIISKKRYKEDACISLNNYFMYTHTTPNELEWLILLCWDKYSKNFYLIQSFIEIQNELENKYIKPNTSRYQEINEYKLTSYQQILYTNLKNWIPPYEWFYKSYTDYLKNILKQNAETIIDPFYYDASYWFNNLYIIPTLNKVKYQATPSKREEIESIILEIEKINNWNAVEWYIWLRNKLTNKAIEEEINKIGTNPSTNKDNIEENLLKNLKTLSYMKIINDEISWNIIKINWYLSINLTWGNTPIFFWSTLENKNGELIVNEITLEWFYKSEEFNNVLKIILWQKNYSMWEIYDYIQNNIKLYISNDLNISPCDLIEDKLRTLKIPGLEILTCNDGKINIIKWESWNKILYQFTMNSYQITSIQVTNKEIQTFVDTNLTWIKTSATTISNVLPNIVVYEPEKVDNTKLEWSNDAITAIDDLKTFLWVNITDIWERNWKVAAEFNIGNIDLIWIYDTNTKILWPLFLKQAWTGASKEDLIINNFSLHLTQDNQNEINKFLIEPVEYLYEKDKNTISKYLPDLIENYLTKKFNWITD